MSTFITRFDTSGPGLRLAVKDIIDMEGVPTTAGCRAVADEAQPASADARCLAGARAAGARIVGRANLHELALGVTGENPWFGTPVNPLDHRLIPGGSSSGCAVALSSGEADVAFGTDTGGSVRIPSACCGTTGLKTTWGRVPLQGVWPLSPSFDTVGPMARNVAGLADAMALLEPGFTAGPATRLRVGRVRPEADPRIDAAVDEALARAEFEVVELVLPEWDEVTAAAGLLLVVEAFASNRALLARAPERIGEDVVRRLRMGDGVTPAALDAAWGVAARWKSRLFGLFAQFDLLAMPTLSIYPPELGHGEELLMARCTLPVNLGGVPALSMPVPSSAALPASLQLVGPDMSEDTLLGAGAVLEAALS